MSRTEKPNIFCLFDAPHYSYGLCGQAPFSPQPVRGNLRDRLCVAGVG